MILVRATRLMLDLLPGESRRRFAGLLVLILLSALVDVVGIGSWYPFVATLSEGGQARYPWLDQLRLRMGFQDSDHFALFLGVSVLLIFILSGLIRALTAWSTYRFGWLEEYRLSKLLMNRYLNRPYSWYLERNTAELLRNATSEVAVVVKKVFLTLCTGITQLVLAGFIVAALVVFEPVVALATGALLAMTFGLFYLRLKPLLSKLGEDRMEHNRARYLSALEAFAAIKEAKIPTDVSDFLNRFDRHSYRHGKLSTWNELVGELPRYCTETLAVGAILASGLYFLTTDRPDVIPRLTVYIIATVRLAPALHKLYRVMVKVRFGLPALETVHAEVGGSHEEHPLRLQVEPLEVKEKIGLRDISFAYSGADTQAVRGVELEIPINTTLALAGKTGSGKTTLADILCGLLEPVEGYVEIDGRRLKAEEYRAWQRNVGYVPQEIYLLDDSVKRNIAFGLSPENIDMERVEQAARIANIHDFVTEQLPRGYDTVLGERGSNLSGGQRQRVGIARALYYDPQILIFDEATSALDRVTERAVMEALETLAGRKTLVVIAHRLSTVKNCDNILFLEDGRPKAQGRYQDLIEAEASFALLADGHPE